MVSVTLYTKTHCPYCKRAKELLGQKGVTYAEINIEAEPERRDEMIERANGSHTVPQIFINNRHIGGCDDLYALEEAGKLDNLLAGHA